MNSNFADFWEKKEQPTLSRMSLPERLLELPADRAANARVSRRSLASVSSLAKVRGLRARDEANARQIAALTRSNEELTRELNEYRHTAGGEVACAVFSEEVTRLIAGDFDSDETDDLIVAMHRKLAAGDLRIAYELECIVAGIPAPDEIDARCLALETLATARLSSLQPMLYLLIGFCLKSDIERLQFRAMGAANLLPRALRLELSGAIKEVVDQAAQGSSTRRLGTLFLENNR